MTVEDGRKGRMTWPVRAQEANLDEIRLCPRFGVQQGVREDGTTKVRAVDNMSWCAAADLPPSSGGSRKRRREQSVNGHTGLPEHISHDHLDQLAAAMRAHRELIGAVPSLFKADVDSAFRRVPLRPGHRWAAGVAYRLGNEVSACAW